MYNVSYIPACPDLSTKFHLENPSALQFGLPTNFLQNVL